MFELPADTCEKTGYIPNPRKHYSGRDIWFHEGDHIHGDAEDFLGLAKHDKYIVHHSGPHDPCMEPDHAFSEIGFGVDVDELALVGRMAEPGLEIGIVGFGPPVETKKLGLLLGDVGAKIVPEVETKELGLLLGDVGVKITPAVETKELGLLLGVVVTGPPGPTPIAAAGVLLGDVFTVYEPFVATYLHGLLLGDPHSVPMPSVPTFSEGILFGDDSRGRTFPTAALGVLLGDATSSTTSAAASEGILFGDVVELIVDDDPSEPGEDCAGAGVMNLDTDYAFDYTTAETSWWWTFPVSNGVDYTVFWTLNSGAISSCNVHESTCPSPMFLGSIDPAGGTFEFTASAGDDGFIIIFPAMIGGPGNGTVRVELS